MEETQQAPPIKKKSRTGLIIGIIIGAVVLLLCLCVIAIVIYWYYFSPAKRVEAYMKQIIPLHNSTVDKIKDISGPIDKLENVQNVSELEVAAKTVKDMEKEANKAVDTLQKTKVPDECKKLKEDLLAYYENSTKALKQMAPLFDYMAKMGTTLEEFTKATEGLDLSSSSGVDEAISKLEATKTTVMTTKSNLERMESTDLTADFHKDMKDLFSYLASFIDNVIAGLKATDADKISSASSTFESQMNSLSARLDEHGKAMKDKINKIAEENKKKFEQVKNDVSEINKKFNQNWVIKDVE